MTNYVAVMGPGTAWSGAECTKLGDISDDGSKTLLLVEVANSGIHWMEPRDLHILQMAPTVNAKAGQGISSRHQGGAFVLPADIHAHAEFLSDRLSAATVRGLMTINGGEKISDDEFRSR